MGGAGTVQVLISFDLLPGADDGYREFVTETGVPFWRRQPGVLKVSGYRNLLGGRPQIVALVECQSAEAALNVLASQEYRNIIKMQSKFVTNRSVCLLEPTGRTPAGEER
jgi:hypothetical protein